MSDVQDMEEYDNPLTTAFGRPPSPSWGRPPTGAWPPCPPRPGPWPGGLFRLSQCWDDVKATRAILRKMIADIIAEDPSLIGLAQPIIGVTDGSDAQPGQVGEYVRLEAGFTFAAGLSTQTLVMGVLQPGDWDVTGWAGFSISINEAVFNLSPLPAGFADALSGGVATPTAEGIDVILNTVRALTSAPSLIPMIVTMNAGAAGNGLLFVTARRRR